MEYSYRHTNQCKAIIATLPLLSVYLMNHRQSPALAHNKKTNTLQQSMFIRGHTHAARNPVQASTLPISNVGIPALFARFSAGKAVGRHFRHFFR
jgi:hypothetical protein